MDAAVLLNVHDYFLLYLLLANTAVSFVVFEGAATNKLYLGRTQFA